MSVNAGDLSLLENSAGEGDSPVHGLSLSVRLAFYESSCLGLQL